MSFKACVSLLIFCLDDLSIGVSEVLKSPTIFVLLSISSFIAVSLFLMYWGAPMLYIYNCYIFFLDWSSTVPIFNWQYRTLWRTWILEPDRAQFKFQLHPSKLCSLGSITKLCWASIFSRIKWWYCLPLILIDKIQ